MAKILLVEDNEMNRDMLSRRLEKKGYTVVMACDGGAGVAMARSEAPDLILMDMSLPVMDGWTATREIKKDDGTRHIPVIALTAHAMASDRDRALEAGCDDYDTKPIELPRLLGKIEALLGPAGLGVSDATSPSSLMPGTSCGRPWVTSSATARCSWRRSRTADDQALAEPLRRLHQDARQLLTRLNDLLAAPPSGVPARRSAHFSSSSSSRRRPSRPPRRRRERAAPAGASTDLQADLDKIAAAAGHLLDLHHAWGVCRGAGRRPRRPWRPPARPLRRPRPSRPA